VLAHPARWIQQHVDLTEPWLGERTRERFGGHVLESELMAEGRRQLASERRTADGHDDRHLRHAADRIDECPDSLLLVSEDRPDERLTVAIERDRLAELLIDAEQRLARVPQLERRISDLEYELTQANQATAIARREAWELDQARLYSRRMLRRVRPLIQLLRRARKRLRS